MRPKTLSIWITGTFLLLIILSSRQWANAAPSLPETSLDRDALGKLTVRRSPSGNVRAVFGPIRNTGALRLDQPDPIEAVTAFFRFHSDAFSVSSETIFEPTASGRISNGDRYVRYSQRYRGFRVLWRSAIVRYSDPSIILHAVFDFDPFIDDIDLEPTLNETDVLETVDSIIPDADITESPELVVYSSEFDPLLSRDVLAWQVSISGNDAKGKFNSWMLVIDAYNGRILERVSQLHQITRNIYDASEVSYDVLLPGNMLIRTEGSDPSDDAEVNLVYDRSGDSYEYFSTNFKWKSFDGKDKDLVACAHYKSNIALFRPGTQSMFNDIDLMAFSFNMATKDIVTHEFTHGINAYTANLVYSNLSGAVEESFADVFATMHDTANWTVGEGSAVGTLRDFSDPNNADEVCLNSNVGLLCPDHLDETYCGDEDHGGVHHNSNILNHAAYEFAQEVGRGAVETIYFDALESCLTERSGFTDTRDCIVHLAGRSHGTSAQKAFDHVGLSVNAEDPCQDDGGDTCPVSLYVAEGIASSGDTDDDLYLLFEKESYVLRDEIFANSDLGLYYTRLYYSNSTAIIDVLLANGSLFLNGGITILANLPGLLELTGASNTSVTLTQTSIDQIEELLKAISLATKDTSLSSTINNELARFDWDDLAGKSYTEAWDHLVDNVDVP